VAILDVFKKSDKDGKKEEESEPVKKAEVKVEKPVKEEKEAKKAKSGKKSFETKELSQLAARFLSAPHVTEKAINMGRQNKYIFKVNPNANKSEVKKAIAELYGVKVMDVNVVNIPRKKKRVGMREGFKSGFKKAVVTLAEGDKIETGI
jgi:large subunit ribosomal protein L23